MIEKIGIIGAGAMGSSIAEVFAFNGYSVYLKDQNMEYVNRGISHVRKVLEDYQSYMDSMPDKEIKRIERNGIKLTETQKNSIKKNLGKQLDIDGIISNIHPVESYKELSQCGLVIEAVFEKQEIKNDLFRELSGYFCENTILASNTSSLSITEMAANYKYPENNIIIHFFNPPYTMPLVEIVPALQTGSKTVETAYSLISGLRNHRDTMVPVKAKFKWAHWKTCSFLHSYINRFFICYAFLNYFYCLPYEQNNVTLGEFEAYVCPNCGRVFYTDKGYEEINKFSMKKKN